MSQTVCPTMPEEPKLSVVLPCLNEADTVGTCVRKALVGISLCGLAGEVIVADNGSTDGSQEIAVREGARVVQVSAKGYGNALMGGIDAARGEFIIVGDADESYDFLEIPAFARMLSDGHELVQGCRLPWGGGIVLPGAMPFLHRWWGNPMFTLLVRWWFHAPIHDVYCGLRGFTRDLFRRLDLRCTGMEFATEMIIKSSMLGIQMVEVPVTLHPDGRKSHAPHLKTFRDGWRTLRFFLLYSPRWLFLVPGLALFALGGAGYALAMPGLSIGRITFDAHTLMFASLFILCGFQSLLFSILTKTFAMNEGLIPPDHRLIRFYGIINLERGLMIAFLMLAAGVALLLFAVDVWRRANFGALNYPETMRLVAPGSLLTALGFQTVLFSFFASLLGMKRK